MNEVRAARANHDHTWLDEIPGLKQINDGIWQEALKESETVNFPAGTKLVHCGDSATHFVIVIHGVVRVFQTAETGREICLYRVRRGQICVLTLTKLLTTKNVCAQAVADEDVRALAMPMEYFHRLLAESDAFRSYTMRSIAESFNEVLQLVAHVSFQRLELRLACLIGKLAQAEPSPSPMLKVTHQEVANELGTTREVVSRILKDFEHMGCIKLRRGSIEVLSGETLQGIAG